jgi:hypothetical protein
MEALRVDIEAPPSLDDRLTDGGELSALHAVQTLLPGRFQRLC